MVTYNDKILVPNSTKDALDTIHPETNTSNVYDFVNNGWLSDTFSEAKNNLTTHESKIASTTNLGHVIVDGTTITIDNLTGVIKAEIPVIQDATTTQKGIVKLNDTLTSTSTTEAATANAVKMVNDKLETIPINLSPKSPFTQEAPGLVGVLKNGKIATMYFTVQNSQQLLTSSQYQICDSLPYGYMNLQNKVLAYASCVVSGSLKNIPVTIFGDLVVLENPPINIPINTKIEGQVTYYIG